MILPTSCANGLEIRSRCSESNTATSVMRMITQKTPTAIPHSTCTFWPVLSSIRAFTLSSASSRRMPARAATAISQPMIRMPSAPRIPGSWAPSVACSELTSVFRSILPPQDSRTGHPGGTRGPSDTANYAVRRASRSARHAAASFSRAFAKSTKVFTRRDRNFSFG